MRVSTCSRAPSRAAPLYLTEVRLISRAYARYGSGEAAARKFTILTLQRAAGRSAETAWLTWEGLKWDAHFGHVYGEWPQPKGSKIKLAAFGAGQDRHACWFLGLADYLVTQQDRVIYSEDEAAWVFPRLQKTKSPGTTVGNYIRALLPAARGGHADFQKHDIVLPKLPPGANAGGIRPGVCNMLNAAMPADLAVHTTAHDLTQTSAFFNYVDATRAGCMPGSVVLGGWQPLPWGQLGMGPAPPSLEPILTSGVTPEALDALIDDVLRLDSATCPLLWRDGALRPMVEAAFASMVMYFRERSAVGEMTFMLSAMTDSLKAMLQGDDDDDDDDDDEKEIMVLDVMGEGNADSIFRTWGEAIKTHFDLANLHLTARSVDTSSAQLVAAVTGVGLIVGGLHAQVASLQREVARLRSGQAAAGQSVACPSPIAAPPEHAPASPQASPLGATAASPAAAVGAAFAAAASATPVPPQQPKPNALTCLKQPDASVTPAYSISGKKAADFYLETQAKGGAIPSAFEGKQQKGKAELCVKWFDAIALTAEKASLRPAERAAGAPRPPKPDEGERRKLGERLHGLCVTRLREAYADAGINTKDFDIAKGNYSLPISGFASHAEVLKGAKARTKIIIDTSALAAWRANHERLEAEAAAERAPPGAS